MIDVLPLVERAQGEVVGESAEGVDQVGAHVRVDVLRQELGETGPIGRPVGVVAHDALIVATFGRIAHSEAS